MLQQAFILQMKRKPIHLLVLLSFSMKQNMRFEALSDEVGLNSVIQCNGER